MIDFYYSPTPNGWKVGIMLEECGLDYNTILVPGAAPVAAVACQQPRAGGAAQLLRELRAAGAAERTTVLRERVQEALVVLENRLRERDYILGVYSIADMACFLWAFIAKRIGVDLSEYPAVQAWRGALKTRPAVRRAIDLHKDKQIVKHKHEIYEMLFNQDEPQLRYRLS